MIVNGVRKPKVASIDDPARPNGTDPDTGDPIITTYVHSSVISDGVNKADQRDDVALSLVAGVDFSALDADGEITTLFEISDRQLAQIRAVLDETPSSLGMNNGQKNRLRNRLGNLGANVSGLTDNMPLWQWASKLCEVIVGTPVDIRRNMTVLPGA